MSIRIYGGQAPSAGPVPGKYAPTAALTPSGNANTSEVAQWVFSKAQNFLGWLAQNAPGQGFISEFGIPNATPDTMNWAEIADSWLHLMDNEGVGVSQWVNGGIRNAGTKFTGLYASTSTGPADSVDPALMPLLSHLGSDQARAVGLGVVAGDSAPAGFCAGNATGQVLPDAATIAYVASLGIKTIRLQFRWEVVQPSGRGTALSTSYLAQLTSLITQAGSLGMKVILDLHNYACWIEGTAGSPVKRHLGDGNLTTADIVDVWTRLSTAFAGNSAIYAYELMNEPTGMSGGTYATTTSGTGSIVAGGTITVASTAAFGATNAVLGLRVVTSAGTVPVVAKITDGTTFTVQTAEDYVLTPAATFASGAAVTSPAKLWEDTTQAVVTAIRGNSDTTLLLISGYDFQAASRYPFNHPAGWITDTASNFRYCAHNYWSSGGGAQGGDAGYGYTWAQELANCKTLGQETLPAAYPIRSGSRLAQNAGEYALPRETPLGDTAALFNGTVFGTSLLAQRNETINYVTIRTGTQALAPGSSLVYVGVGIYEVSGSGNSRLVAQSANLASGGNTSSAFTVASTFYKIALAAPFYKRAGKRYLVGVLINTAATYPKLSGAIGMLDTDTAPWQSRRLSTALTAPPLYVPSASTNSGDTYTFQAKLTTT